MKKFTNETCVVCGARLTEFELARCAGYPLLCRHHLDVERARERVEAIMMEFSHLADALAALGFRGPMYGVMSSFEMLLGCLGDPVPVSAGLHQLTEELLEADRVEFEEHREGRLSELVEIANTLAGDSESVTESRGGNSESVTGSSDGSA